MKRNAILFMTLFFMAISSVSAQTVKTSADNKAHVPEKAVVAGQQDRLPWWPTDAQPAPVKDEERGGFWWWPSSPGTTRELWGNRGYAYVNKIIYDWHDGGARRNVLVTVFDVGFSKTEDKPSLMIKRTIRSQKLQFKENNVEISAGHAAILVKAIESLKRNKDAEVLLTAHNDTPELGSTRTRVVEKFLIDGGVAQARIKVVSSEKIREAGLSPKQTLEPGTVQLIIAEIKEVMIPGPKR